MFYADSDRLSKIAPKCLSLKVFSYFQNQFSQFTKIHTKLFYIAQFILVDAQIYSHVRYCVLLVGFCLGILDEIQGAPKSSASSSIFMWYISCFAKLLRVESNDEISVDK